MFHYFLWPFSSHLGKMIFFLFIFPFLSNCYGSNLSYNSFNSSKERIYTGEGTLKKTFFYYGSDMSGITHLACEELDSELGPDIGIFTSMTLRILDLDGNYKDNIQFRWRSGVSEPAIRLKKEGGFEIIARRLSLVGVMDQKGRPIWAYKPKGFGSMAIGDLNQDNLPEYYVADGDLVQLNEKGEKIWEIAKKGFYNDVEILESLNGKKPLLVTSKLNDTMQFLDYQGKIIREIISEQGLSDFQILFWMDQALFLTTDDNEVFLINLDGKIAFRYKLSHCPTPIYSQWGVPVRLSDGKIYLAIVADFSSVTGLSMLCLFSPDKELVYQELIKTTTGILAVKFSSSEGETLLVGDGPGRVYKYIERK
jgi:hypothetical protein